MLKDMTDSKRIDQHIQAQKEVSPFLCYHLLLLNDEEHSACYIRRLFRGISGHLSREINWTCQNSSKSKRGLSSANAPTLTRACRVQDRYAKGFTEFKPDKKLHWLPQLGTITLEIELQDRTIEAEVTPLEAAVIGLFEEKGVSRVQFYVVFLDSEGISQKYGRQGP